MNIKKQKQVIELLQKAHVLIESARRVHEGRGIEEITSISGNLDNLIDLMTEETDSFERRSNGKYGLGVFGVSDSNFK